jgi:predicted GH43/DUF377 family glycosyl hydrolase
MTRVRAIFVLAASIFLVHCSSETVPLAPIDWQRTPGGGPNGSVLGFGPAGNFDEAGNFTISAFKDTDGVYKLYYGGADTATINAACTGINGVHWRIGLATSPDGLTWTRVQGDQPKGSILDNGTGANDFDTFLTYRPYVLHDGSIYRMWYNGSTEPFNCPNNTLALNRRIGYAESPDGVHFTKMNNGPGIDGTMLPLGGPGSIDEQQVGYVWVIKDTNEYKMYYSANDAQNFWRVGLATSPDARTWTKKPGKLTGGAVLDLGPTGSFDVACAYQPSVFKERDQLYRMWYRGCQSARPVTGGPSQGVIGYAESNDGITWVKALQDGRPFGAALVAGVPGTFDSGGLTTPSVFLDGNTWNMYYAGFDTTGVFLTGLARAPHQ